MEHLNPDQIVLLALGEDDPSEALAVGSDMEGVRLHLRDCAACRHELAQFTRTVEIARDGGEIGLQNEIPLPGSIWAGIAEELDIGIPVGPVRNPVDDHREPSRNPVADHRAEPSRPADPVPFSPEQVVPLSSRRRPTPWRRVALIAAAVAVIGAGVVAGIQIGKPDDVAAPVQSAAALDPVPDGPASAHGSATVTQTPDGLALNVNAEQLPLRQGYYAVWLYDPVAEKMIAVGTLGPAGDGLWTLASTIDLQSYNVIDVSAQDFDGDPAHKASVLRGTLTG